MWCTNRLLWHTSSDFYGVRTPLFMPYELAGFKKALLQNPREMIRGANFQQNDSDSGPKVRDTGRKSELQTKSRRYSPESEPNRPEKGPEWVQVLLQKTPLKALLNPPNMWTVFIGGGGGLSFAEYKGRMPAVKRGFWEVTGRQVSIGVLKGTLGPMDCDAARARESQPKISWCNAHDIIIVNNWHLVGQLQNRKTQKSRK